MQISVSKKPQKNQYLCSIENIALLKLNIGIFLCLYKTKLFVKIVILDNYENVCVVESLTPIFNYQYNILPNVPHSYLHILHVFPALSHSQLSQLFPLYLPMSFPPSLSLSPSISSCPFPPLSLTLYHLMSFSPSH